MKNARTSVEASTTFHAQHRWANCPHEEVAFLRNYHRHVFHVKVSVWVAHNERDVEFLLLKKDIDEFLATASGGTFEYSCETFAHMIANYLQTSGNLHFEYDLRSVSVSEDGENGATLHFTT